MGKRLSTEQFIKKSEDIHGRLYDYSLTKYENNKTRTEIICQIHGIFFQAPRDHLRGNGCPKCGIEKLKNVKKITKEKFLYIAECKYNNAFDYSLADYKDYETKIKISCLVHGIFLQSPHLHLLAKHGCPKCGKDAATHKKYLDTEEFILRAQNKHHYRYDYSLVNYKSSTHLVRIQCLNHGAFDITPGAHIQGNGCGKCASNVSKQETKWLDSLNVPTEYRQKILYIGNIKIKTDAYDPLTNTIYEYNGDFWHGNPNIFNPLDINARNKKTFGELYNETKKKRELIISAGYNLIEIWDSEWHGSDKYSKQMEKRNGI